MVRGEGDGGWDVRASILMAAANQWHHLCKLIWEDSMEFKKKKKNTRALEEDPMFSFERN